MSAKDNSALVGYIQIPEDAWLSIPKDSKIMVKTNSGDMLPPFHLKSVQDTSDGLLVVVDAKQPRGKSSRAKTIPAKDISELWKYIPDDCRLEVLLLLDIISVKTDELTAHRGEIETLNSRIEDLTVAMATLSSDLSSIRARMNMTESNMSAARRAISAVGDDVDIVKRDLIDVRRCIDGETPSGRQRRQPEPTYEFGDQFPQRATQRRQIHGRASVTDRMFIPDSPM